MLPIYGYAQYQLAFDPKEIKTWLVKFIPLKAIDSIQTNDKLLVIRSPLE